MNRILMYLRKNTYMSLSKFDVRLFDDNNCSFFAYIEKKPRSEICDEEMLTTAKYIADWRY